MNATIHNVSPHNLCHFRETLQDRLQSQADMHEVVGFFVLYGSWNTCFDHLNMFEPMRKIAEQCTDFAALGCVRVDESEESLAVCLGDDGSNHSMGPIPPEELPALVVVTQHQNMNHSISEFVAGISPRMLMKLAKNSDDKETLSSIIQPMIPMVKEAVHSVQAQTTTTQSSTTQQSRDAIRIFVSGDKSSVGKSSVCLGILASLVKMGYDPSSLAYIKPATQCEAPQLIQKYCESVGIHCIPVGPVVYFKGFTRAFLAGETDSSEQLLASGGEAVDELARGKRIIMIDGVGFPSVGSICGTDNASMARACGYPTNNERTPVPVLIVGGSGVGAAVDAFNLNATYFESKNVPVLGAIFNKLSMEGFYSLENCREQVTRYFDQTQGDAQPFGFVPLMPEIAGDSAMDHVDEFVDTFREYVNVQGIVDAAARYLPSAFGGNSKRGQTRNGGVSRAPVAKRAKLSNGIHKPTTTLSREAIEAKARQAGAAPSA